MSGLLADELKGSASAHVSDAGYSDESAVRMMLPEVAPITLP
jgi:hypothetical protein